MKSYLTKILSTTVLFSTMFMGTGLCQVTPAPITPPTTAWYVPIQPNPPSGPITYVGPWKWFPAAADWAGSAMFLHSFQCHLDGGPECALVFGNGYAYPKDYPYVSRGKVRVPTDYKVAHDPVQLPLAQNPGVKPGWYRFYYAPDGTAIVFPRTQNAKYRALVLSGVGKFTQYGNINCPGWPFFLIGSDIGQNDYVCN